MLRLAVALLAALSVACTSSPARAPSVAGPAVRATPSETRTAGHTFRWAIQQPRGVVPWKVTEPNGAAVVDALFDSLTAYDASLRPVPAAASRWTSSDDASVWTFSLRSGATFHDGSPVTALDFKRGWERLVREGHAAHHLRDVAGYEELRAGRAEALDGVQALDRDVLRVQLARPQASFPAVVAHPALGPIPTGGDERDFEERPIGNGPYRAGEGWNGGRFLRLARFDDWLNTARVVSTPGADPVGYAHAIGAAGAPMEVLFLILSPADGYLAFEQGRVDFTVLPPRAQDAATERFGSSPDGYTGPGVLTGAEPTLYYAGFNVEQAPFDDPEVRRAISLAVDREAMARDNLHGNSEPSGSAIPSALPFASPQACAPCRGDRATARSVFAERGITELTLWVNSGGGHERVAAQLQRDLAAAGVTVHLRWHSFSRHIEAVRSGEAGWYRLGWPADYPTIDNAVYPLFHSQERPERGGGNYARYAAEDVDALLDDARRTRDAAARARLYEQAAGLAVDRDHAIVPLLTLRHAAVASERVRGLRYTAMRTIDLTAVRFTRSSPAPVAPPRSDMRSDGRG